MTELALALELLPRWALYAAGVAHGALLGLYLPGALAWCWRRLVRPGGAG